MKISSNGQANWRYVSSPAFHKEVKQSMSTIADQKTYALAVKAFSQSISHIRTDPLAAGGPRYRFHHLNLLNYVYVTDYFIIQYALDEERHLIYLRKFILFQS